MCWGFVLVGGVWREAASERDDEATDADGARD
jgi:hypothetical protein